MTAFECPPPLRQVTYLTAASLPQQLPEATGHEILCIGRSNAGKSSVINATLQHRIACTSRTPGRTQLLHFFQLKSGDCLIDCPGYGFAAVSRNIKSQWPPLFKASLKRPTLAGILWIMDIRHPLQTADLTIQKDIIPSSCPIHIILNKSDQLRFGAQRTAQLKLEQTINTWDNPHLITVQTCSTKRPQGLDQIQNQLCKWLHLDPS